MRRFKEKTTDFEARPNGTGGKASEYSNLDYRVKLEIMTQLTKIITIVVFLCFQNLFGQNNETQTLETPIYEAIANSEFDLIVRINNEMNDEEVNSRIAVLQSFVQDLEISYSRDTSGNIKTLSSSAGKSEGFCKSDDFGFLIISLSQNQWRGCMISDKE